MAKILEFPPVDRTGHVIMLVREKASRYQCRGVVLGLRNPMTVVPAEASMHMIQQGIRDGILIDVTEHPEFWELSKSKELSVVEEDVGKMVFTGTRQFFRDLGIDPDPEEHGDEMVCFATADAEEQKKIQAALLKAVRIQTPGQPVRLDSGILLAPGMDDPEKYLL